MARGRLRWADASELSNRSRPELPATFILRIGETACSDLGISQPGENDDVGDQHPLLRKFIGTFTDPAAIDDGVPLAQMRGRGLYRIRAGDWRGAVWADTSNGVVWLCRAVRLANYPSEAAAYDALEAIGHDGIFPGEAESSDAQRDQFVAQALRAMRDAMQEAHELPNSWQPARMRGPGEGKDEGKIIGRAYVEEIEVGDEVLTDRFVITVTRAPEGVMPHEEWVKLVMARVFLPQEGEVDFVGPSSLPPGHELRPGPEIALAQNAL